MSSGKFNPHEYFKKVNRLFFRYIETAADLRKESMIMISVSLQCANPNQEEAQDIYNNPFLSK